ncbi:hypothetical protein [Streptomyces sp. A012304]|uniref:hypothetical protein n=1 Tax=Streptomyces sp. A012304 TaxID=375446 RepID=UPI00222E12C5|nr:hypothetical protein [Streptomyces sp. A012304]GKQ35073.1 hypothetical protein ALMP_16200 [Streptomyces sp. A012304]
MPSPRAWPVVLLVLSVTLSAAPSAATAATAPAAAEEPVVPVLERAARPLLTTEPDADPSDLHPIGRAIGDASVVGMGEATHGSHEFVTLKHRVFHARGARA